MALETVPHLLYEPEDNGICWIKFNRPERMNALAPDTMPKVAEYMKAADEDPQIRVVVLTGVGRGFCAGADLRPATPGTQRAEEGPDAHRQHFMYYFQPCFYAISQMRKPTIAMVNGPAVGGGMDMSLHCDLRVGCERTRFFTYQNVGQIIENGGFFWLPRIAGFGHAMELLLTGGFLEAQQAYEWGILNKLVPSENLEAETRALCQKIIDSPPLVQWVGKRIMRRSLTGSLESTLELCAHSSAILATSEDAKEARKAFVEKRKPHFQGR